MEQNNKKEEFIKKMSELREVANHITESLSQMEDLDINSLDEESQKLINNRLSNELHERGSIGKYLKNEQFLNGLKRFGSNMNDTKMFIETVLKGK
jgi:hypothetical protein